MLNQSCKNTAFLFGNALKTKMFHFKLKRGVFYFLLEFFATALEIWIRPTCNISTSSEALAHAIFDAFDIVETLVRLTGLDRQTRAEHGCRGIDRGAWGLSLFYPILCRRASAKARARVLARGTGLDAAARDRRPCTRDDSGREQSDRTVSYRDNDTTIDAVQLIHRSRVKVNRETDSTRPDTRCDCVTLDSLRMEGDWSYREFLM